MTARILLILCLAGSAFGQSYWAYLSMESPPGFVNASCSGPDCSVIKMKEGGCSLPSGDWPPPKFTVRVIMEAGLENCYSGYAFVALSTSGMATDWEGNLVPDAITGIASAQQLLTGLNGTTTDTDSCNFPYVSTGPFEFTCLAVNLADDPPCNEYDPSSPCYQPPPCNPLNPYGFCYAPPPCYPGDPACGNPPPPACDETDPDSPCYQPPGCDSSDPYCFCQGMADCWPPYPPCDPSDPYGGCYDPPPECSSRNPDCGGLPPCDPEDLYCR